MVYYEASAVIRLISDMLASIELNCMLSLVYILCMACGHEIYLCIYVVVPTSVLCIHTNIQLTLRMRVHT